MSKFFTKGTPLYKLEVMMTTTQIMNRKLSELANEKKPQVLENLRARLDNFIVRNCGNFAVTMGKATTSPHKIWGIKRRKNKNIKEKTTFFA